MNFLYLTIFCFHILFFNILHVNAEYCKDYPPYCLCDNGVLRCTGFTSFKQLNFRDSNGTINTYNSIEFNPANSMIFNETLDLAGITSSVSYLVFTLKFNKLIGIDLSKTLITNKSMNSTEFVFDSGRALNIFYNGRNISSIEECQSLKYVDMSNNFFLEADFFSFFEESDIYGYSLKLCPYALTSNKISDKSVYFRLFFYYFVDLRLSTLICRIIFF
jgi:hypothetical protein